MTTPESPLDQLMDTGETQLPQFATVMRGYDRGQVDDYVARLNDFVADAEARAERAERGTADIIRRNERLTEELRQSIERGQQGRSAQPYEGLGERIEHILRLAGEEADAILQKARAEAEEIVTDAQRRRDSERENAERELAAVAARRDSVVGELRRVQDALATLGLRQAVDEALPDDLPVDASPPATGATSNESSNESSGGAGADRDAETPDPDAEETRVIHLPSAVNQT